MYPNWKTKKFNRVAVQTVELIAGHGIRGDRKAGRNPKRQINIISLNTVQKLKELGFQTHAGTLGEQLVVAGIDVMDLAIGTQIQLGDSALIELTMVRTSCQWLEKIHGQSKGDTIQGLGMLAKVVEGGRVSVTDKVKVLDALPHSGKIKEVGCYAIHEFLNNIKAKIL